MSNNKQKVFKLVNVDFKDGLTFTMLVDKNQLQQTHFPISVIENFFGGKNKIQGGNNEN